MTRPDPDAIVRAVARRCVHALEVRIPEHGGVTRTAEGDYIVDAHVYVPREATEPEAGGLAAPSCPELDPSKDVIGVCGAPLPCAAHGEER